MIGVQNAKAEDLDITSYLGNLNSFSNGGLANPCENNHDNEDAGAWWNSQNLPGSPAHSFRTWASAYESWSPANGSSGVAIGRTVVLPAGNYTLTFKAFGGISSNASDTSTQPSPGDVVAFCTGMNNVDVTNTTINDGNFHDITFNFSVKENNTTCKFGLEKKSGKANWFQIQENSVSLVKHVNPGAAAAANKEVILAAKGDATWLVVNPTFDENANGWSFSNDHETTASQIDRYNGSSWRGGNNYYVDCNNRWYTITQTINNMPAGTYKLVAAMRGKVFGIRPSVAGTDGSFWYGTNEKMINKNGVVMPVTDITKNEMNYANDGGTQWNWVSVTGKLETNGDLTIAFKLEADKNCWACLDDVHLYYMSDDENSYAHSLGEVSSNVFYDNTNNVITKDVIVTNPNVIIKTNVTVETAMGQLNNNLVSGTVANLVLYDGYEFSADGNFTDDNITATAAKLYRNIAAGGFATICAPFAISSASGTFYEPTSFTNNVLTFGEPETLGAGKAYLFKASADVTELTGAGEVNANPVDNGTGVIMKGTYNRIATIDHDNYILSSGTLYKVDSDVSLNPFRAYFNIPLGDLSPARLVINFDDFTGINVVDATEAESDTLKDGKYIIDNKVIIVKNGVKYSTNGQILN